jgi:hypothetical protein
LRIDFNFDRSPLRDIVDMLRFVARNDHSIRITRALLLAFAESRINAKAELEMHAGFGEALRGALAKPSRVVSIVHHRSRKGVRAKGEDKTEGRKHREHRERSVKRTRGVNRSIDRSNRGEMIRPHPRGATKARRRKPRFPPSEHRRHRSDGEESCRFPFS